MASQASGIIQTIWKNRDHMLRNPNHRYAVYHATDAYGKPRYKTGRGIDAKIVRLLTQCRVTKSWDEALQLGEQFFKNAR